MGRKEESKQKKEQFELLVATKETASFVMGEFRKRKVARQREEETTKKDTLYGVR